jgi:cell division protein FtsW (lipid II flippase)
MATSMILVQAGVNIGMNMGLLPITGITLPLLSYGGSSVITIMGMMGILQSIARNQQKQVLLNIS